jgi:hypothetical protein
MGESPVNSTRLFAYGTLMFPPIIESVIGRVPHSRPAGIKGYMRLVVTGELFPGLVANEGTQGCVQGLIYLDITPSDWKLLIAFEDEFYSLKRVDVQCCGRNLSALAFVVSPARRSVLSEKIWDPDEFRNSVLKRWGRRNKRKSRITRRRHQK